MLKRAAVEAHFSLRWRLSPGGSGSGGRDACRLDSMGGFLDTVKERVSLSLCFFILVRCSG